MADGWQKCRPSGRHVLRPDLDEAVVKIHAVALRVMAERLEQRQAPAESLNVSFQAA